MNDDVFELLHRGSRSNPAVCTPWPLDVAVKANNDPNCNSPGVVSHTASWAGIVATIISYAEEMANQK